jgi:esterase
LNRVATRAGNNNTAAAGKLEQRYASRMESDQILETADGARLYYRLTGRGAGGTVLLMLHGLASNSTRWRELAKQLRLEQSWDLLRPDLRGHGRSMFRGRIGHDVWTEDLHAILEHHGYRQTVILGHSLGAQLALFFASRYPALCAGLVLIDPVFPDCLQGNLATVARLRQWLPPAVRVVWGLNALGLRRRHFPELDLYQLDRTMRELLATDSRVDIASRYARPSSDLKYLPLANYLQDLYEVTRPLPAPASIRAPLLVLLSQGVKLSDLEANRQRIAEFPRAETVVIDADHWMLTERPQQAREAIEAWCNRLQSSQQ